MPREASDQPTDVELSILRVLWDRSEATVREVHDALADKNRGLSSTLKMMQVMRDKGLLTRDDSVRPQIYTAAATQEQTQLHMLDDLTQKAFGGSAASLVMRMLSAESLSPDELEKMQELIQQAREEKK